MQKGAKKGMTRGDRANIHERLQPLGKKGYKTPEMAQALGTTPPHYTLD